tara:strand:- start:1727 stop:2653 length:927 start_codon:yes stop_codon:yes gene_type:complete
MKILNTIQDFDAGAKKILEKIGDVEYRILSQYELKDAIKDYEAIIIGIGLRLDKESIDVASKLKFIATATTGTDHVEFEYAKEKGVKVLSLQNEDLNEITGTAELAFGLLLSLVRRIPQSFIDVKKGNWEREKFLGNSLTGKTLGIVGLGRLGTMMAKYGKAFGMHVLAHDPNVLTSQVASLVSFDKLSSKSDIVSVHVHLSDETSNMFNEQVFSRMKDTAYLINTSRGAIVNEKDLLRALETNNIAGYATDVLSDEVNFSRDVNHSLIEYAKTNENVIITPHIGGYTAESRSATDKIIAQRIIKVLY